MANSPSAATVMNEIINSMWDEEVGQIITGFEQKGASYLDAAQNLEDILIDVNDARQKVKPEEKLGWDVFIKLFELEKKLYTTSADKFFGKYAAARDMSSNMKDGLMDVCSRVALEPGFVMTPQLLEMAKRIAAQPKQALQNLEAEWAQLTILENMWDLFSEGQKKILGFEN
ncbi:hypothetical protein Ocin01_18264, partial [Orchesella cincta]